MNHRLLLSVILAGLIACQGATGATSYFNDIESASDNDFTVATEWQWDLTPDSGVDTTDVSAYYLTAPDLADVAADDKNLYDTQNNWGTAYSDSTYLGFTFPDIPISAQVNSVAVTVYWQKNPHITGARLKIRDGLGNEQIYPLNLESSVGNEFRETIDITAFINTAQKINAIEIYFQAICSKARTTSHNLIRLEIN